MILRISSGFRSLLSWLVLCNVFDVNEGWAGNDDISDLWAIVIVERCNGNDKVDEPDWGWQRSVWRNICNTIASWEFGAMAFLLIIILRWALFVMSELESRKVGGWFSEFWVHCSKYFCKILIRKILCRLLLVDCLAEELDRYSSLVESLAEKSLWMQFGVGDPEQSCASMVMILYCRECLRNYWILSVYTKVQVLL